MIKATLKDLVNAQPALMKIATYPLPAVVSYQIAKALKLMDDELNFFYNERTKIVNKYATKKDNGEVEVDEGNEGIKIAKENMDLLTQEINDLSNIECTFSIDKFSINTFDKLEFTPQDLMNLQKFFE